MSRGRVFIIAASIAIIPSLLLALLIKYLLEVSPGVIAAIVLLGICILLAWGCADK